MDSRRELKLIRAAQRGNQNAVAELYDAYVDQIFRYVSYRIDDRDTAHDLTAEVFLRMIKDLPGYQPNATPLVAWLYRIAHARIVDYYRSQSRRPQHTPLEDIEFSLADDENLEDGYATRFRQQQVREALRQLTDEQRQVLLLRFMEGYDLLSTAQILGKTVGAVKVLQHRAVNALARILNSGDDSDSTKR